MSPKWNQTVPDSKFQSRSPGWLPEINAACQSWQKKRVALMSQITNGARMALHNHTKRCDLSTTRGRTFRFSSRLSRAKAAHIQHVHMHQLFFFFFSVGQILSLSSHFHSCPFYLCIRLPIAVELPQHQYASDWCWSLTRIRINDIWQRETLTKTLFFFFLFKKTEGEPHKHGGEAHKRRRRRCDSRKRSKWSKSCSRHSWHEQTNGQAKTVSYSQCCYC